MAACLNCGKIPQRKSYIFCSNKCQKVQEYKTYIESWKSGLVDGNRGINTRNISGHIKKYLVEEYGEKYSLCNWNQKNPITQKIPLEIDHVNGNSEDNHEENLRLICPNCHSLSKNFRNLNRGKGRNWRKLKYVKVSNAGLAE